MEVMMRDDNNCKAILFYFKPLKQFIFSSELLQLKRETFVATLMPLALLHSHAEQTLVKFSNQFPHYC